MPRRASHEDVEHVAHWLEHRNDVAALEALISRGYVVDTMEVAGRWRDLPGLYAATTGALREVEGTIAASAHQSHTYPDGGCLYFTFAGKVDADERDRLLPRRVGRGHGVPCSPEAARSPTTTASA